MQVTKYMEFKEKLSTDIVQRNETKTKAKEIFSGIHKPNAKCETPEEQ